MAEIVQLKSQGLDALDHRALRHAGRRLTADEKCVALPRAAAERLRDFQRVIDAAEADLESLRDTADQGLLVDARLRLAAMRVFTMAARRAACASGAEHDKLHAIIDELLAKP